MAHDAMCNPIGFGWLNPVPAFKGGMHKFLLILFVSKFGMFKKLKNKAMVAMMKRQMSKSGANDVQQQMLIAMVEKNPELFEKIAKEIEVLKKQGKGEMAASMMVMKKYQAQIQKAAQSAQ
jgi:hypothetical protein